MNTYIALLRGVNVGGNHMLPMKELKLLFEQNGCSDVRTYIQSGNVVFCSRISETSRLEKRLATCVSKSYGFEPKVLVLTTEELEIAAANNPFPEAEADPKSVHLFFLTSTPEALDIPSVEALKAPSERFELSGRVFYLHTPDGFGISKLAGRVEQLLGVPATARNWRTVTTLLEMARS
ncbi:MAG: DUF1697 domain-containing protein [Acidobacteria bacterium]|nr:MAG: DUF1697 domain-containing protein [Acidobacteriota bacterium]